MSAFDFHTSTHKPILAMISISFIIITVINTFKKHNLNKYFYKINLKNNKSEENIYYPYGIVYAYGVQ